MVMGVVFRGFNESVSAFADVAFKIALNCLE